MNILISSIVDVENSAPQRIHHIIRHLSEKHSITVLCINDYWKSSQVDSRHYYRNDLDGYGDLEIRYITEKNYSPILQELLSFRLIDAKFDRDFDVLFNYNTLISGYYLARKLNIPMVYDMADDLPAMVAHSPQVARMLRSFGGRFAEMLLHKNFRFSEVITCTSNLFKERYRIPDNKFILLPNGVDSTLFAARQNHLKDQLGLQDSFVLGYVGVLREWVDFEPVCGALQFFDDVKLLIVGEEGRLEENKDLIKGYGLQNQVAFLGTIPHCQVPEYISVMNACLIPFTKDKISQSAVPIKLFEYLACERPVISTSLEGIRDIIGDRILYADTPQEYISQIRRLLSGGVPGELVREGREFVCDNYSWNTIVQRLETELEKVCETV